MSDPQPSTSLEHPAPAGYTSWPDYWTSQGMPWRTEPEIGEERKQYLAERRAVRPDIEKGVYPFKDIKLDRADVEWLLATHESGGMRGPVDWSDESQRERTGIDLRGADLRDSEMRALPLAQTHGGLHGTEWGQRTQEQRAAAAVQLERSALQEAHLEGSYLRHAHMKQANLTGAHLEGADLFHANLERAWLVGAHLEGTSLHAAHLEMANLSQSHLEHATLYGASLIAAYLSESQLGGAALSGSHLEGATLVGAHLTGADLSQAHLEMAVLSGADLTGAFVGEANLAGANFTNAHLEGANLMNAHLGGHHVQEDHLALLRQWAEKFPEFVPPANLRLAFLNSATVLNDIVLGNKELGHPTLADVRWNNANLAVVEWTQFHRRPLNARIEAIELGDEREARQPKRNNGEVKDKTTRQREYITAVRANRQLATTLRSQGLNEDADRFALRAQRLQRQVLRRQGRLLSALGSWFLDLISGYGYRPIRSLIAYVLVILGFAAAYFALGGANGQALSWNEAIVISMTAFHGRGFFSAVFQPGDLQAAVAAVEAFIGLLIEIVLIATFTQRFFAR